MEKKVERKDNLEVVVTVKVNGDEWKKLCNKLYNKQASKVVIKGFRPGKAPANMIKSRINMANIYNDAIIDFANQAYGEAIQENKFYVYSQPKINVSKLSETEAEFDVVFDLVPEIKLGQYKGLDIACDEVKVSAKDVTAYIDNLKSQHAIMQVKEGKAKLHDSVIIDFVGYVDGEKFDGGSANGYELELGSNSFIPGFEDQLVGIKAGDKKSIEVTFPENYVESLKGKKATFEVTCQDVKEKVIPELDEAFFEDLGIATVKDEKSLKDYAKTQVTNQKNQEALNAQLEKIVNKAVDNAEVKIPNSMIEEEANAQLAQIKKQVEDAGLTYADYVAINGLKEEELDAKRKQEAAKNLKSMLVIEKIIIDEKLNVTEEKLEAEYERIAKLYGMEKEQVKKALESNKDGLVKQLRNKLFTDFMYENNKALKTTSTEEKPAAKKTTKKASTKKEETSVEEKPAAKKTTTKKTTSTTKKTTTKKATKKDAE
jgi:trigger factor